MNRDRGPRGPRWAWAQAAPAALAALVAVVVHAPSVASGFTGLDDVDLIVDDQAFLARPGSVVAAFGRSYMHAVNPAHAYYRPVVTASLALDSLWSGARPAGYHATNVVLHALACALFVTLLRSFSPGFSLGRGVTIAAGILFAVHPALASAVAWIPGRNDSLLAIFVLAAWLLFLRDLRRPSPAARVLHLTAFTLALFTKETAVVLPAVLIVHAGLLEPDARRRLRDPAVGGVLVAGWLAALVVLMRLHPPFVPPSGAELRQGLSLAATALGKLVLPFDPTVLASSEDSSVVPGLLAGAGLATVAWLVPGVRLGVMTVGVVAFAMFLAPVLAAPGTLVLDNRLYLPACGVILVLAELARASVAAARVEARLLGALSGAGLVALAALTMAFERSFHDRRAFAREAVAGSPHSALAHFCLGQSFQLDGDEDRALAEYAASLALGPAEVVHNNIAVIHMANGRWPDAERELRDELAIDPRYARAYSNLAIVLRHEGRLEEAAATQARADALEAP